MKFISLEDKLQMSKVECLIKHKATQPYVWEAEVLEHASLTWTQDGGEVRSPLHTGRFLTAKRVVSASFMERRGTTLPKLLQAYSRAVN